MQVYLRMECGDNELRWVVFIVGLARQHACHSRPAPSTDYQYLPSSKGIAKMQQAAG